MDHLKYTFLTGLFVFHYCVYRSLMCVIGGTGQLAALGFSLSAISTMIHSDPGFCFFLLPLYHS